MDASWCKSIENMMQLWCWEEMFFEKTKPTRHLSIPLYLKIS
jgi:hypothetical protein